MFRGLLPLLTTVLAVLLDTAVIPVFYRGIFLVPVTLAVVLCIGVVLGRMRGMLFGMVGGLLIDITTGTLGVMTFFFLSCGFMIGLLIDEVSGAPADAALSAFRIYLRRAVVAFFLYLIGETVILVFQYFQTAVFEWRYILNILMRTGIFTILTVLLSVPLRRLYLGNPKKKEGKSKKTREVTFF